MNIAANTITILVERGADGTLQVLPEDATAQVGETIQWNFPEQVELGIVFPAGSPVGRKEIWATGGQLSVTVPEGVAPGRYKYDLKIRIGNTTCVVDPWIIIRA